MINVGRSHFSNNTCDLISCQKTPGFCSYISAYWNGDYGFSKGKYVGGTGDGRLQLSGTAVALLWRHPCEATIINMRPTWHPGCVRFMLFEVGTEVTEVTGVSDNKRRFLGHWGYDYTVFATYKSILLVIKSFLVSWDWLEAVWMQTSLLPKYPILSVMKPGASHCIQLLNKILAEVPTWWQWAGRH